MLPNRQLCRTNRPACCTHRVIFITEDQWDYLQRCKRDPDDRGCRHPVCTLQGRRRCTWDPRPPSDDFPPCPATENCATWTSPSESSWPTSHQTPWNSRFKKNCNDTSNRTYTITNKELFCDQVSAPSKFIRTANTNKTTYSYYIFSDYRHIT